MSHPSGRRSAIAVVTLVVAVQALMLFAFAWPGSNPGPREVPVAVAGPPEATDQLAEGMRAVPGADDDRAAFDVRVVADGAAAERAIEEREVYGAVVVTPQGPELLVASGAGPAVSQLLESAAGELVTEGSAENPPVTDVAPGHPGDPNGAGLAAAVLPLVITSGAAGVALGLLVPVLGTRLWALAGLGVLGGLGSAAILQYAIDASPGPYLALAGGLGFLILAVACAVAGLSAVWGRVGAGLGMLTMVFLGNPLSAAPSAPEMIPGGSLGQVLPPGAGMTLVRSLSFFDGAGAQTPMLVLGSWLAGGLLLLIVGSVLRRTPQVGPAADPATPPVDGGHDQAGEAKPSNLAH